MQSMPSYILGCSSLLSWPPLTATSEVFTLTGGSLAERGEVDPMSPSDRSSFLWWALVSRSRPGWCYADPGSHWHVVSSSCCFRWVGWSPRSKPFMFFNQSAEADAETMSSAECWMGC